VLSLSSLPSVVNLVLFVAAASAIWFSGTRLTIYSDIISDRTGISKAFIGFIFLATVTQLPELVTNTTGAIKGNAALVVNSMFGGIAMQTAVLVIADVVIFRQALTFYAYRSANQLQGVLLILALTLILASLHFGDIPIIGHVGAMTVLMAVFYIISVGLLWRYESSEQWKAINIPEEEKIDRERHLVEEHHSISTSALIWRSFGASLVILACGVLLVFLAETIATQSGLGSSFIGVTLLAISTSLPELSTAIMAVRLGAHSMAISDVFGSNLIMVFLLLPTDVFYSQGLLFDAIDRSAKFALVAGILLTATYLIGLYMRSGRKLLGIGLDSWAVLFMYVTCLVAFYHLR